MGFDGNLVEKLGTTPKLNFTESSFFLAIKFNLKFGTQLLWIFGFDSLVVLV